ncbi:MAG: hypothetical protein ACPKPY_11200 [Nitrososphaeraceae archaeon]
MTTRRVILIGLKPDVVDYTKWPGLTPKNLMMELKTSETNLNSLGYDVQLCLIDLGETAKKVIRN